MRLFVVIALIFTFSDLLRAEEISNSGTKSAVFFKADELENQQDTEKVIARGNVEIVHEDQILRADSVLYDRVRDKIYASGNVTLLRPDGDVLFSDTAEITGDLREGILENIRILLADNSRAVATTGRLRAGKITSLERVSYSPCQICPDTRKRPTWQINAQRMSHNKKSRIIEYRNAFLKLYGFPVAYTPYLLHPDPKVKRKTGLLPIYNGSTSQLGWFVNIPYFIALDHDKDLTVELMPTAKGGQVVKNQYRQRFSRGFLELESSGTATRLSPDGTKGDLHDNNFRGHVKTSTQFDLTENWRTGADIWLTSDDLYMKRYEISDKNLLKNSLFIEGFKGNHYIEGRTYFWRDLRSGKSQDDMPVILPMINYHLVGPITKWGGNFDFKGSLVSLTRGDGADSRRLSLENSWNQRNVSRSGHVFEAHASLETDLYYVTQSENSNSSGGTETRIHPRLGVEWRYPLESLIGKSSVVLEPIGGVMLSPRGGNSDLISNEDSQAFEFDDTNLLSRNMFPGRDRIGVGQRLFYGFGFGVYGLGGYSSGFLGQTYHFNNERVFPAGSGVEEKASDFVGRLILKPALPIEAVYRFQIDNKVSRFKRNSLQINGGSPLLKIKVNYDQINANNSDKSFTDREEIYLGLRSNFSPSWSADASLTHDLVNGFTSEQKLGLTYSDDCFQFKTLYNRTFFRDREIEPNDALYFQLIFKNLGNFQTSSMLNSRKN
ncbi:MAG: LPS assembly protein LptD [Pseudomonadota bacterium]|nr:LPS assembly protein LptD [Pseudomonadota bacterium]